MQCINCNKRTGQMYNGSPYCLDHHPQRLCPKCGANAGKWLKPGEWCGNCKIDYMSKNQLPLFSLAPYGNTGVTPLSEGDDR